jgi:hypothetical protein
MPTITHNEFEKPNKTETEIFEISDGLKSKLTKDDTSIWAQLFLDKESKDIKIKIYIGLEKKECEQKYETLTLEYIDHSQNGLFYYKFNVPENHPLFPIEGKDGINFPCDMYHKMKEFFHNHEYHFRGDGGDATLKPFIITEERCKKEFKGKLDIKTENNPAIIHYFRQYNNKFNYQYIAFKRLYDDLINKHHRATIKFFLQGFNSYKSFFELAFTSKGESIYYNALYRSWYNETDNKEKGDKDGNRIALNIENIIKNITNLESIITNTFTLRISKISFWIAISAIIISVLCTVCKL